MAANDKWFTQVDEKLDHIGETLNEIAVTLAVNTAHLEEHMRRTELLEKNFEPVEDHVKFVNKFMKTVAWLIGLAAATLGVWLSLKSLSAPTPRISAPASSEVRPYVAPPKVSEHRNQ